MSWQSSDMHGATLTAAGDPPAAEGSSWRWLWLGGAALSALGAAACLVMVYSGFDGVLHTGGSCASGGPYAIAHRCSGTDTTHLIVGILGGLACTGACAWFVGLSDGPAYAVGLLAWTALFGSLGYGFLQAGGGLVLGVMFVAMGAGGLVPVLIAAAGWLRRGGRPEPEPPAPEIVRANVRAQAPGSAPGSVPPRAAQSTAQVPRRISPPRA